MGTKYQDRNWAQFPYEIYKYSIDRYKSILFMSVKGPKMKFSLRYSILAIPLAFGAYGLISDVYAEEKAQTADEIALEKRSEDVFSLCINCHGYNGEGNKTLEAPAIAGLPEWYITEQLEKFSNGGRGKHFDDVAGMRMRPMAKALERTEGDMEIVAAYVASLPVQAQTISVHGDAEKGKQKYLLCSSCHGADGKGNKVMNAPPLVGSSDWYLISQLDKFRSGVRGGNPSVDVNGSTMAMQAQMILKEDQDILDVVAYIGTLK
jgi:cytochrome c553